MPTNVTVDYSKAEQRYQQAKAPEDQLSALFEMQRTAPSHKGAEKLRAEISRKIRKTREKIDKREEQRKKASSRSIAVKKAGIGQVVLVGMPNSGKSTLLEALTNADVAVAPYPFTTKTPQIGMVGYMKARIQLVEVPPLIEGSASGKAMGRELFSVIRTADAVVLVLDSEKLASEYSTLKKEFESADMAFNAKGPLVLVEKAKFPGISVINQRFFTGSLKELKKFLRKRGYSNSMVVFRGKASLADVKKSLDLKVISKRSLAVVVEKKSAAGQAALEALGRDMAVFRVSSLKEKEISKLKDALFGLLERVLVFTKKPGSKAAEKPMSLPLHATVEDAAKVLHKDFEKNFRYAKIWGSAKYPGQRVARDYELKTGDTVEIY